MPCARRPAVSALIALALLSACKEDETLTGYGAEGRNWIVQEWHGTLLWPELEIRFETDGTVAGTGPCNSFGAVQTKPYPWFALEEFTATEAACPALATETVLFSALQEMTLVEIAGTTLILTDDRGRALVFTAATGDQ